MQFLGQFFLHMSHPSSMYFSNAYADTENFLMIPQCPGDIISVEYYLNRTFCRWRDAGRGWGTFWVWIQPHSFHLLLFRLVCFIFPCLFFQSSCILSNFTFFLGLSVGKLTKIKIIFYEIILSLLLRVNKWKGTLLKKKENLNTSQ